MQFFRHYRGQRGDTIVEVMIAIAIVSSVLAGAFTVTQKSSQAVRSSQERAEMLQFLQGQMEEVRSQALQTKDTSDGIYKSGYFCLREDNGQRENFSAGATVSNIGSYPTACQNRGSSQLYAVAISYDQTEKVFTALGKWNRIGGGINQSLLSYKIYPAPFAIRPPAPAPPCETSDIIMVLDNSISMSWEWTHGEGLKIDKLKEVVITLINELANSPSNNYMAVTRFNESRQVIRMLTNDTDSLASGIRNIVPADRTYYLEGLKTVDEVIQASGRPGIKKSVVFVSDGLPTDTKQDIINKINQMTTVYPGITISTIGIDMRDTGEENVLYQMIRNGGHFGTADSPEEFDEVIAFFARELRC